MTLMQMLLGSGKGGRTFQSFNGFSGLSLFNGYTSNPNNSIMTGVAVNSTGRFVAVGYREPNNQGIWSTSTDGINWTTPALFNGFTGNFFNPKIAVNQSDKFVVIASPSNAWVTTSTNGTTWDTPTDLGFPGGGNFIMGELQSLIVDPSGRFIYTFSHYYNMFGSPFYYTYSYYSTTGAAGSWNSFYHYGSNYGAEYLGAAITNSSGVFLTTHMNLNTNSFPYGRGYWQRAASITSSSADTYYWPTSPILRGYGIAVNSSGRIVVVGDSDNSISRFSTSTDGGLTFSSPELFNGLNTYGARLVAVNFQDVFVTIYGTSGYSFGYSSSTNGTNWTSRTTVESLGGSGGKLTSVAVDKYGRFVVVGGRDLGSGKTESVFSYSI